MVKLIFLAYRLHLLRRYNISQIDRQDHNLINIISIVCRTAPGTLGPLNISKCMTNLLQYYLHWHGGVQCKVRQGVNKNL